MTTNQMLDKGFPFTPATISPSQRTEMIESENKRLREEADKAKRERDALDVDYKRLKNDVQLLEEENKILVAERETLKWVIGKMTG